PDPRPARVLRTRKRRKLRKTRIERLVKTCPPIFAKRPLPSQWAEKRSAETTRQSLPVLGDSEAQGNTGQKPVGTVLHGSCRRIQIAQTMVVVPVQDADGDRSKRKRRKADEGRNLKRSLIGLVSDGKSSHIEGEKRSHIELGRHSISERTFRRGGNAGYFRIDRLIGEIRAREEIKPQHGLGTIR